MVEGNVLTVLSGAAKGLRLLYTGYAPASGVQLDLSIGLAPQIYDAVDSLVNETGGLIAGEVQSLESQNELGAARAERLEERLERERERLLERFIAMETALATMNRLLESLRQQIDASFGDRRKSALVTSSIDRSQDPRYGPGWHSCRAASTRGRHASNAQGDQRLRSGKRDPGAGAADRVAVRRRDPPPQRGAWRDRGAARRSATK